MSKRRNLLDSQEKRKSLQKNDGSVGAARGRLKGALKTARTYSDDNSSEAESPPSIRPPEPKQTRPFHYIMKLFDRSVDLAQFDEDTPLYPLCRAWMQNQPRLTEAARGEKELPKMRIKREYNPDIVEQYQNGEITTITSMPRPEYDNGMSEIPERLECQKSSTKDNIDLGAAPIDKKVLLNENKQRWRQIRQNWISHRVMLHHQRYGTSIRLLNAMRQKSD